MRSLSHGLSLVTRITRKNISHSFGLALIVILYLMKAPIAASEELRQRQIIDDVEIFLVFPHAEQKSNFPIESQDKHHLVAWLLDGTTSKPIEDAQVKAEVAEDGYVGSEKILEPMVFEGKPSYGGIFRMPDRVVYRIMIKIERPGKTRAIEAHFKYQHHHQLSGRKASLLKHKKDISSLLQGTMVENDSELISI